MAHTKSCSGTLTILGWGTTTTCNYQLTLFIDGVPITTAITANGGMSDAQIAALFNANRTGNTTGTISVQTTGLNLNITINNIILPVGATGIFSMTILGTGFPCPDFVTPLPSPLTCNIIPDPKKKKRSGFGMPAQVCIPADPNNPDFCPPNYIKTQTGYMYELIGKDQFGNCCYQLRRIR